MSILGKEMVRIRRFLLVLAVFVLTCGQCVLAEEQGGFPITPLDPFGMCQKEEEQGDFPIAPLDPFGFFQDEVEGEMQEDLPIDLLDPFGMSQEEQAGGYILSVLPARRVLLRASRPSGAMLTGTNKKVYTALVNRIKLVANGKLSSTVFSFPAGSTFEQAEFTAEELGLEGPMFEADNPDQPTEEAIAKTEEKISEEQEKIDFNAVMNCLLADCPYHLYWFAKAYLMPTDTFSATGDPAGGVMKISGNYTVTFYVSQDYAIGEMSEAGEWTYDQTRVNPMFGESVEAAAENIADIIDYALETYDEYGRLCYYRDVICGMASYNHEVGKDTPYGDPWQLVWVFDGKPNTKVVCEGYAKALQYLCDLDPMKIEVISVQGSIPEGAHMWNIARVLKRNYLIDLTNYDIGHDLFMKGYSDGDVESGYWVSGIKYEYDMEMTERTEDELRLSRWDYGSGGGELRLPAGTEEIEDYAFEGGKFEAVIVPDGCGYIGHGAFKDCKELVYARVPGGCFVEEDAFEGCERLK